VEIYVDRVIAQLVATIVPAAMGLIGALLVLAASPRLDTDSGQIVQPSASVASGRPC
jgi:hypothetical protein